MAKILVAEDDVSILTGLSMNLHYEGYEVIQAQSGSAALQKAIDDQPDLIILDIMLPDMNGFEVLSELRGRGRNIPVIVLSAKGLEADKIAGLNLGADDYVAKPFGLQELIARIKAVLRRHERTSDPSVEFGDVCINLKTKTVTKGGAVVDLTAQELRLLLHWVAHPGRVFSRDDLLSSAWGFDYAGTARTVDNFVSQLRQKLEDQPDHPLHLVTVRGLGYRFDP